MIIHLIGAQESNYPWGFENRLISAIKELGHDLISTDFRKERTRLPELIRQKADLVLVCKGENIDPQLIESCNCITALWYAEQLGKLEMCDETALGRRRELAFNVGAFDYVFTHDPANILVYKRLGAEKVFPLPCAAVDPSINLKLDIPKKYDVVFVGSKTERRQNILNELKQCEINIHNPNIWDSKELNRLFNESRIVLNLHLSDMPNTETRVAEVLGSGSFLLSENLSDKDLVEHEKHFCSVPTGDVQKIVEKINYYLLHESERENIAQKGHDHIRENHTYTHRIKTILEHIDFSLNSRIWPSYILGVPSNKSLKPTLRLDRYNSRVEELLKMEINAKPDFQYSQEWYDSDYHQDRLGLDARTFDEVREQYEKGIYQKRFIKMVDSVDIPLTKKINWMEVACHAGLTGYWAASKFPDSHLYMFDFSKTAIDWLNKQFPLPERATIWQTSVEEIKLPDNDLNETMDVVTCLDVTEHLPDNVYKKMITEIFRVMKPGGILLVMQGTAPNEEHIHILPEEQIDRDFLDAGFEKLPSPQPNWHYFRKRRLKPVTKTARALRIFAAFSHVNWEEQNFLPALESFGEVIHFSWDYNDQYRHDWHSSGKSIMNLKMLEALMAAHQEKPVDLFFGYLSGRLVFPGTIRKIQLMGIPSLNICLDDKAKFVHNFEATGHAGMIDIANAFTLCWTSSEDAIEKYKSVGAKAIYLPSGANPDVFKPYDLSRDIDVSFIGQKYGQRPHLIKELRNNDIAVKAFGKGWESGEISQEEMVKIYSRSKITLGFAGVGESDDVFCLKGRDFEVTMSGGFYLTQYHPELERWFEIDKEIVCYTDINDMIKKIKYYLSNPAEADKIRKTGYQKALENHTWIGRFNEAFKTMGIL